MGNKCDDPDLRVVQEADARRFAENMKINYCETSAKENINVDEVGCYGRTVKFTSWCNSDCMTW